MKAEMHEVQPLMHLLSTYVIKPIAFDANPYVLPRAAQFVKYAVVVSNLTVCGCRNHALYAIILRPFPRTSRHISVAGS